jgi:hypothetical protein
VAVNIVAAVGMIHIRHMDRIGKNSKKSIFAIARPNLWAGAAANERVLQAAR